MPLYEYRCARCDHRFEVYHPVGGTAGPCPECGGPARRVFSSVGLIFKGSGFHATDYRKTSPASSDGETTTSRTDSRTESPTKASS